MTIVIATKNEEYTIWGLLNQLQKYNVILVDDSTDATISIARRFENVKCYKGLNVGISDAYRLGLMLAWKDGSDDWILQMDAGGAHDPHDVPKILEHRGEADLVYGARKFYWKNYRTAISRIAARMMRVPDATCGFRLWNRNALATALASGIISKGNAFQLEMLYAVRNMETKAFPIEYTLDHSNFKWKMVWEALRVYLRKGMWRK